MTGAGAATGVSIAGGGAESGVSSRVWTAGRLMLSRSGGSVGSLGRLRAGSAMTVQAPVAPQPQRRMPNLFSRVTGGAGWAKPAAHDARESQVTPQLRAAPPRPPVQQPAPTLSAPPLTPAAPPRVEPAPVPAQTSLSQTPQPAAQPRLSGLDPKDRIAQNKLEEDLLDIPAFLRRQAN